MDSFEQSLPIVWYCVHLLLSSLAIRELATKSDSLPVEVLVVQKRALHSLSLHGLFISYHVKHTALRN